MSLLKMAKGKKIRLQKKTWKDVIKILEWQRYIIKFIIKDTKTLKVND